MDDWQFRRLESLLLRILERTSTAMAAIDDDLAVLTAQVAAETTEDAAVVALLNGIPGMIATAVAAAQAAGATPAQLAAITTATATIQANVASLAAAVVAGTPSATIPLAAPVAPVLSTAPAVVSAAGAMAS